MLEEERIARRIKEIKTDINLLNRDLSKVKHALSISHIENTISSLERKLEQFEFKLWKAQGKQYE